MKRFCAISRFQNLPSSLCFKPDRTLSIFSPRLSSVRFSIDHRARRARRKTFSKRPFRSYLLLTNAISMCVSVASSLRPLCNSRNTYHRRTTECKCLCFTVDSQSYVGSSLPALNSLYVSAIRTEYPLNIPLSFIRIPCQQFHRRRSITWRDARTRGCTTNYTALFVTADRPLTNVE